MRGYLVESNVGQYRTFTDDAMLNSGHDLYHLSV